MDSAYIIDEVEELQALEPEWWELWRRSPRALPFQSPAWLLPWWGAFQPGTLCVLAARKGDRLIGLAPGYVENGQYGRRILPLGISLSDQLDVLVDPECPVLGMARLVAAAASISSRWDSWDLEDLPPGADAFQLPLPPGWGDQMFQQQACPVLTIPKGTDDISAALPTSKRKNLNLARNRCARRGLLEINRADLSDVSAALEVFMDLHGRRWQSQGEVGVMASDQVRAFQRQAAPALQAAGLLRLYTLSIAGRAVAAHYGLVHGKRAFVYLTGLDPDYAFESPGVVLMAHAVSEAVSEGCREIDFLRGRDPYKYEWGAIDRWTFKRSIRHAN